MLDGAATAYVDLVRSVVPDERLALVPPPGFPRSPLDGTLRARIVAALRTAAWLPAASPPTEPGAAGSDEGAPAAAELDEGAAPAARWGRVVPRLRLGCTRPLRGGVGAGRFGSAGSSRCRPRARARPGRVARHPRPRRRACPRLLAAAGFDDLAAPPYLPVALTELGARRVTPAELVERLFGSTGRRRGGGRCTRSWAELADVVPGLVDELRALPVPLSTDAPRPGPPTVLLPGGPLPAGLAGFPACTSPTPTPCTRCSPASAPRPPIRRPCWSTRRLQAAVERSVEDAEAGLDTAPLAEAVLALLGAGAPAGEELARSPSPTPTASPPAPTS